MWLGYAILAAFFASMTAIFAKIGLKNIDSNLATAIRTIVILAQSWLVVFLSGAHKSLPLLTRQNTIFLVLSGLATGFSWLCYYRALQTGPVSKVVAIDKFSVVLTIILAVILFHETITLKTVLGCLLLILGITTML